MTAPIFDDFFESSEEAIKTDLSGLTKRRAFLLGVEMGKMMEYLSLIMPFSSKEVLLVTARNKRSIVEWAKNNGIVVKINKQINDDLYELGFYY